MTVTYTSAEPKKLTIRIHAPEEGIRRTIITTSSSPHEPQADAIHPSKHDCLCIAHFISGRTSTDDVDSVTSIHTDGKRGAQVHQWSLVNMDGPTRDSCTQRMLRNDICS